MTATAAPNAAEAQRHAATIAAYLKDAGQATSTLSYEDNNPVVWGESNFYIPTDGGKPRLIKFYEHQKLIMRLFFDPKIAPYLLGRTDGKPANFQTLVYSTIKKSGKTALAALVARWITETWGSHAEVYSLANDLEQARGRIYQAALTSIELDPRYRRADKGIAGLWRIVERQAAYLPSHSSLKAVSSDYKGEAGSNPTATFWSELWGYETEAAQRLWEELTPVPTRPRSIRYVETYAGYEGESSILNDLEDRIKLEGRRITREELTHLGLHWPFPVEQPIPLFIHAASRTFAYWDTGTDARRMLWQTPEYYQGQASDLRDSAFRRLHLNERVSNSDEFIPSEWWDRLALDPDVLPPLDAHTPIIIGADASVTGDCSALVAVSRDPQNSEHVVQRLCQVFVPQNRRPLDYSQTIEPTLREWCLKYNVVEIAYDEFQLHDMMTRMRNEAVAWCRKFGQQQDRAIADKALFDLIRDKRIHHTGDPVLTEHIGNCAAKVPPDDNSRMRLVKKSTKSKIDAAVALSMASSECLRLNL